MKLKTLTPSLSQQNTTVDQVLKEMQVAGIKTFDADLFHHEAMNALDLDWYTMKEIRQKFKELLKKPLEEDDYEFLKTM